MSDWRKANLGMGAEAVIDRACLVYRRQGLALINKVPTPATILSSGKGFFRAKAICDYVGTLKGGIALALETKSTKNRTRFPLDKNTIKPHQLVDYLQDNQKLGGVSAYLFLWWENNIPLCLCAPLNVVIRWHAMNLASITFDDMIKHGKSCWYKGNIAAFDFLPHLESLATGRISAVNGIGPPTPAMLQPPFEK